jgi:hypothetical protein
LDSSWLGAEAGSACVQVWLAADGAAVPLKEIVDYMRIMNM